MKKSLLLIAVAALFTYLLKPFRFTLLDAVFLVYSVAVFNLQRKQRTAATGLFVALPHTAFGNGNLMPLIVALGSSLRFEKNAFSNRLYGFLKQYNIYALAYFLSSLADNLFLKTLLLSPTAFLLAVLVESEKSRLFFVEDVLFVTTLACLYMSAQQLQSLWIVLVFMLSFLIYNLLLGYKSKMKELEKFQQTYADFRKKLATVVELVNHPPSASVTDTLRHFAKTVSDITGFRYVLISVLNRELGVIQRVAHYGMSEEEFSRLRENPPPIEHLLRFTQERFRVSSSYFIPEGTVEVLSQYSAVLIDQASVDEPDAWRPQDFLIVPIYSPLGEMVGYISVDAPESGKRPRVEDVQLMELIANQVYKLLERSELYRDIVSRQPYDSHTLLLTHSAFLSYVDAEIAKGNRFAIVILDVDDLSLINQRFGHEVGDRLLEKIADILRTKTRKTDIAARFGGEEFALLLRNVTKSKAIEITDRLLQEVRRIDFQTKVSVSAGIAIFPEHGKTSQELTKAALQALQIAKISGKDRLMVF
ncbi:sensor domain-containing diguanylate cyclase [Thermotoga sp. Ku-13t]|uniref:sensor domain-containing diguanylate cyclase n=1 Tax=Thermotoga sp. Ku-13t TaxID=1755813 RepID=UPI0013E9FA2B|nr:sensor domain-containing diguanylate cyclase [Thermotoga sp. Ku-13t]